MIGSLLAVALVAAVAGCGSKSQTQPEASKGAQVKLVKVQQVVLRTMVERLELPGTIRAENVANVLASSEGKITQLLAREGDRVEEGEVLAMVSPLVREDIVNSARLLVQSKREALQKNPSDPLLRKELEQAETDYQFALGQYKEVPVTAPISGLVSQRWVDLGDMVVARAKLFEIQSSNRLRVDVPVSELDVRQLRVGQQANIRADACPARTFSGRIQRIHPQVDSATRTALVEVSLQGACPTLRPGMFVRVTFAVRTLENVPAIPSVALLERPGHMSVFVVGGETAKEVTVEPGLEVDGWVEIRSGLEVGDRVVVEGQDQLKNGAPVKVQGQKAVPRSAQEGVR